MRQRVRALVPGLAIVQVGGREDSNVYIRMKIRAAADIGIQAEHVHFPRTITQTELLQEVRKFKYCPSGGHYVYTCIFEYDTDVLEGLCV